MWIPRTFPPNPLWSTVIESINILEKKTKINKLRKEGQLEASQRTRRRTQLSDISLKQIMCNRWRERGVEGKTVREEERKSATYG